MIRAGAARVWFERGRWHPAYQLRARPYYAGEVAAIGRASSFWQGFLLGILIMAAFMAGITWQLSRRGLTITLDTSALAAQVEAEVRDHIRRELPAALSRVRAELPEFVAGRVAGKFQGHKVNLGPIEVELPASVVQELESRLAAALTEAAADLMQEVDADQVAARVGAEANALVRSRVARALSGWHPEIKPLPWLTVPVTIRPG